MQIGSENILLWMVRLLFPPNYSFCASLNAFLSCWSLRLCSNIWWSLTLTVNSLKSKLNKINLDTNYSLSISEKRARGIKINSRSQQAAAGSVAQWDCGHISLGPGLAINIVYNNLDPDTGPGPIGQDVVLAATSSVCLKDIWRQTKVLYIDRIAFKRILY